MDKSKENLVKVKPSIKQDFEEIISAVFFFDI